MGKKSNPFEIMAIMPGNQHNHDHDHGSEFDAEWLKSEGNQFVKLLKNKSFEEIVSDQPDYKKAFLPKGEMLKHLCCSDGRVELDLSEKEGKLATAGQCILYSEAELEEFIIKNKGGIKKVSSHFGCGAAKVKFDQMIADGITLPEGVTTSDELGIYFTKNLAERLEADYDHIGKEDLCCPVHNERVLVVGPKNFDPTKIKDFPAHFSSASIDLNKNPDYVKQEIEILSGIATGEHGFYERFTAENPFYILAVAKDQTELDNLEKLTSDLVNSSNGRIKFSGSIIPNRE